jgi:hypothetical protein
MDPSVVMNPTSGSVATNYQTVLIAVVGLASTIASGVIAIFLAKINIKAGLSLASNKKAEESIEKVHVAVNSERTAMLEKIDALRAEILELSKSKAVAEEREAVAHEGKK